MNKWQRVLYFFLAFISLITLFWIIFNLSPELIVNMQSISVPISIIFYILLFMFCILLGKAFTKRFIHGASIGIFLVALLLLKTNNVFQPFLIVLLIILIIGLEIAFWQRKKKANNTAKRVAS